MIRTEPSRALAIRGLCKRFDRPAVDHLALAVRTGEFYSPILAEGMAHCIALIAQGRLTAPGTLDELRGQVGRDAESFQDAFVALIPEKAVAAAHARAQE